MMLRKALWIFATIAIFTVASARVLTIPPQGGPENGFRPGEVIDQQQERFLGQLIVKFTRPFPDVYNVDGSPIKLGDPDLDAVLAENHVEARYITETLEIASYASDPSASGKALIEYLALLLPQIK